MMGSISRHARLAVACALAIGSACAQEPATPASEPVAELKSGSKATAGWSDARIITGDPSSSAFLRGIYGKPVATQGDVLLAAGLIADEEHWSARPGWALKLARSRGLVRGEPDFARPATRGFACQVFARLLKIRGGLGMRLSGQSGRYAYHELYLLGLIPKGGGHLSLTGDELAGLIQSSMRYRDVGPERPPGR